MANASYLLGTHSAELERLRFQHQLWRPMAEAAWRKAGVAAGQRILDVGAGPGFAAVDLAQLVGTSGRVLGLELSHAYVEQAQREASGLPQLEMRQHDLHHDPWPSEHFDLIWCRWVAMFLRNLDPLLAGLARCSQPGSQVLFHEYVHWDTFGLYPHGAAITRFGQACQASFVQAGGDPDVNRRLPTLLSERGWRIKGLQPLPVAGNAASMAGRWMQRFVQTYSTRLLELGLWTTNDQAEAEAELAEATNNEGSFWVGPTVLEVWAERLQTN